METFKAGYYEADTINGVSFYGEFMEDPNVDIMSANDFHNSLDTVEETETIYAFFGPEDQETWERVNEEYGITE
jgi:hypothetical protein